MKKIEKMLTVNDSCGIVNTRWTKKQRLTIEESPLAENKNQKTLKKLLTNTSDCDKI
uniref:hypothetical protein n=1 Tax=Enterocloster clostridioformis TaxID=1531 RepID=UPI00138F1B67|nr:hypothetical protein [Enterocloster clostridioformis]